MKNVIKVSVFLFVIFAFSTGVYAMGNNQASILAKLTNKTEAEIIAMREDSTYGEIALNEDVYDEFKEARVAAKKAWVDQKVEEGKITKERAIEIKERIEAKSQNCDGKPMNLKLGGNGRGRR